MISNKMQIQEKERMLLEIVLGAVLIIFLITLSIVIINASEGSEIEITNSYNNYTTINSQSPNYDYYNDHKGGYLLTPTSLGKRYIVDTDTRYLRHESWAQRSSVEGLFGNNIDKYEVYVRNHEYEGGYFKVIFYFEDYYGEEDSEAITQYIGPQKEQKFTIKDVSSKYEYKRLRYTVHPLTKIKTTNNANMREHTNYPVNNRMYFYQN